VAGKRKHLRARDLPVGLREDLTLKKIGLMVIAIKILPGHLIAVFDSKIESNKRLFFATWLRMKLNLLI
jgi:hypothetical protein